MVVGKSGELSEELLCVVAIYPDKTQIKNLFQPNRQVKSIFYCHF